MKRRISLAISTIGNPKIIFLDEPTTGVKLNYIILNLIKKLLLYKKDGSKN